MNKLGSYEVVGIGSAIVDVLASVDEAFLDSQKLEKGTMALIDAARAAEISASLRDPVVSSGGSTSNTMAGLASFGGAGAFIGKVADDKLGHTFVQEMNQIGVDFLTKPLAGSSPTAQSIVLMTPDAQRTMNTYLGVASQLEPADVDPEAIAAAQILFTEGYMWDSASAKAAVLKATEIARENDCKVSFSLSDPLCVERHREEFHEFLTQSADIVFANASEVAALYDSGFTEASARIGSDIALAFVTQGSAGSTVLEDGKATTIAVHPMGELVDTTGAGDQYAAGVLFGLTQGHPAEVAGRLGSLAGGEVVTQVGARPHTTLADLVGKIL